MAADRMELIEKPSFILDFLPSLNAYHGSHIKPVLGMTSTARKAKLKALPVMPMTDNQGKASESFIKVVSRRHRPAFVCTSVQPTPTPSPCNTQIADFYTLTTGYTTACIVYADAAKVYILYTQGVDPTKLNEVCRIVASVHKHTVVEDAAVIKGNTLGLEPEWVIDKEEIQGEVLTPQKNPEKVEKTPPGMLEILIRAMATHSAGSSI
jgi:hypothetical protein